jgi:hypothetical protein
MVRVFMKRIHWQKKKPSSPPRQEIGSQGMGGKQVETTKPLLIIYYK